MAALIIVTGQFLRLCREVHILSTACPTVARTCCNSGQQKPGSQTRPELDAMLHLLL